MPHLAISVTTNNLNLLVTLTICGSHQCSLLLLHILTNLQLLHIPPTQYHTKWYHCPWILHSGSSPSPSQSASNHWFFTFSIAWSFWKRSWSHRVCSLSQWLHSFSSIHVSSSVTFQPWVIIHHLPGLCFHYSLPTRGHLPCFGVLSVMNKATKCIHMQVFWCTYISTSYGCLRTLDFDNVFLFKRILGPVA